LPAIFLHELNQKYSRNFIDIEAEAQTWLQQRSWPGNVRELKGVMERGVLMGREPKLSLADLDEPGKGKSSPPAKGEAGFPELDQEGLALDQVLRETERRYFEKALGLTKGNERKAAELLGMNYHTFRYRRKKLLGE
jgi:DNA-binding NtrC family response regulator